MIASELMIWGLVAHLVGDFLLQNEWMATNKVNPKHPAGWVHALIHVAALLAVGWTVIAALMVGLIHWFIDLRFPLAWWRGFYRQTTEGPMAVHVAIWEDQVVHIVILASVAGTLLPSQPGG